MISKKQRIPREIVKKVISDGHKGYSELFLLKKIKNGMDYNRYVVVVSKKVSKTAVGRHQIKRKIKGALKSAEKEFQNEAGAEKRIGNDIVVIASPTIKNVDPKKITTEIKNKKDFLFG